MPPAFPADSFQLSRFLNNLVTSVMGCAVASFEKKVLKFCVGLSVIEHTSFVSGFSEQSVCAISLTSQSDTCNPIAGIQFLGPRGLDAAKHCCFTAYVLLTSILASALPFVVQQQQQQLSLFQDSEAKTLSSQIKSGSPAPSIRPSVPPSVRWILEAAFTPVTPATQCYQCFLLFLMERVSWMNAFSEQKL